MSTHAYLCHATLENELIEELKRFHPSHRGQERVQFSVAVPGVVLQENGPVFDPAFARQVLPNAKAVICNDHETWIQHIYASCPLEVQDSEIDWAASLHVFAPDAERKGSEPIPSHFFDHLAEQTKKSLTAKIAGRTRKMQKKGGAQPGPFLLQVLITGPHKGWVSYTKRISTKQAWPTPLSLWPVPFEAGRAPVVADYNAPSSAHRKLQEALMWLNDAFKKTDIVWDAGAAPGGWSYEAISQGAKVYAVDRGKMDPILKENSLFYHIKKDAFTTEPTEPVDFLVCDIIETPDRVLGWLKDFASKHPLRGFIVTLKLKKPLDFKTLEGARRWAEDALTDWQWRIKNLRNNKLEVTFMARCSE